MELALDVALGSGGVSATSSGCRSSSTARARTDDGPRSSVVGGRWSCSGGSTPARCVPAFGPPRLDPRAGAVLVGARPLLIAFNIELATGDLDDAQAIAAAMRESSGGMRGVQALGLLLPGTGRVQVSLNVVDVDAAPLVSVVERVREVAAERGVEVGDSELVGLLPERAVADPGLLGLGGSRTTGCSSGG